MADAYVALVDRDRLNQPTRHFIGPPAELAGRAQRTPMPHPAVVLIEVHPEGPMLYRYTAQGGFAGDTWHEDVEQAKAQAQFDYGDALGEWQEVPAGISDAHGYAINAASGV